VEEKIMPGSLIRVTPEQLNSVAGQLNAGASSIDGTLAQLRGNVAPLGSDWAGTAQWQSSSRALHQALVDIGQLMNQAGAAYDSNEQQIASSFGR
jgi:WXG100 family type VII secretion target